MDAFKNFSKSQLQRLIGEEIFADLEIIISGLSGKDIDPDVLFRKETLVRIYLAFADSGFFKSKKTMRMFLNSQPREAIAEICKETNINETNYEKQVEELLKKGWSDIDFCSKFLDLFNLPTSFLPALKNKTSFFETAEKANNPFKTLKDYQFYIYQEAISLLLVPKSRFIIQMPTGSGKTRTAMEIIADVFKETSQTITVFWLAHSQELCEQAIQCFIDVWSHVGNREVDIYRIWGNQATIPHDFQNSAFLVGGFQKLFSILNKDKNIMGPINELNALLVIDEAHKVLAPTYEAVTKSLIGSNTKVIGLTATPGRNYNDFDENKLLAKFFFDTIITIKPPNEDTVISFLRSRKVLSRVKFQSLNTSPRFDLTPKQKDHFEKYFDFAPGFLDTLSKNLTRNIEITKKLDEECRINPNSKVLYFGTSIEQSKFICSLLVFLGYKAMHVDGSTNEFLRKRILNDYISGDLQIICNYGILSTGFDAPKTDIVFIARPTGSIVLYSQMIGRGLRGPAIGGTEECKIITVKDNIIGLPDEDDIYYYFDDFFKE